MKDIDSRQWKKMIKDYGESCHYNEEEKIIGLNHQFFAAFTAYSHNIFYAPAERIFYYYNAIQGIWEPFSDEKVLNIIGKTIHHYAEEYGCPEAQPKRSTALYSSIMKLLKGQVERKNIFSNTKKTYVHCKNVIVEYDEGNGAWCKKKISPKYFSRNQNPIKYDPECECPQFLNLLLKNAMSPDDIEHLRMYIGQCLLGVNLSQTFLLLMGTPGGGKSTLVNVIEGLIGRWNCTELRLEHMSRPFEISRANGKSLLTGKDVESNFLSSQGAKKLKALVGNDTMSAEFKNSNSVVDIHGDFNVIITSNNLLRIEFDGDIEAWRRRLLLIQYDNPPPKKKIVNFDKKLLTEEGSGILNWALGGALKLLHNGGTITKSPKQEARIDMLLKSSRPFTVFGDNFIHTNSDASITTEEVTTMFMKFCDKMTWAQLPERKIQHLFHEYMQAKHGAVKRTDINRNGRNKRGYVGYQIRKK